MTWAYTRAARLLQFAPWADMDLVREPLIAACDRIVTRHSVYPDAVEYFQGFKDGVNPTLPRLIRFENALYDTITSVFMAFSEEDGHWGDAHTEMRRYFFNPEYWLFIQE